MSCHFEPKATHGPLAKRCAVCGEHKDLHRAENDARECSDRKQDLSYTNLQVRASLLSIIPETCCCLQEMPAHLRTMYSLTTLILSNNQISQLPAWVGELHSLRELYLDNNKLVELPNSFCQLQLRRLSLGCNPLSATLQQAYDRCPPLRPGIGRDPLPLLAYLRDCLPEPAPAAASHQQEAEATGGVTDPLLEASFREALQAAGA